MAMFLVVGCQTTQSAETETVPEVVKEVQQLPKEEELSKNMFGKPVKKLSPSELEELMEAF